MLKKSIVIKIIIAEKCQEEKKDTTKLKTVKQFGFKTYR